MWASAASAQPFLASSPRTGAGRLQGAANNRQGAGQELKAMQEKMTPS
jgi:hypothetical protein